MVGIESKNDAKVLEIFPRSARPLFRICLFRAELIAYDDGLLANVREKVPEAMSLPDGHARLGEAIGAFSLN